MDAWTFPCELKRNYDGDTFDVAIRLPFKLELAELADRDFGFAIYLRDGQFYHDSTVRLHGVDTPELRGGTDLTKAAAKLARDKANEFLAAGDIILTSYEWAGKYGRVIGDFSVAGQSLASYLITEGLGVVYGGGSRTEIAAQHEKNAASLLKAGKLAAYVEVQ